MRTVVLSLLTVMLAVAAASAQVVGTMSELMIKIIYPASDAIFYVETRAPTTDAEWVELQGKALMVAESANLLMLPAHAKDRTQWMDDARLMRNAGATAFEAAKKKDLAAVAAVNDALYESCTTCHRHYRPNYGRGRGAAQPDSGTAQPGNAAPQPGND